MKLKFKYTIDPGRPAKRPVSRPYIDIILIGPSDKVPVTALIDSGADYCLFPADLASLIGIQDYKTGIFQPILTAGGASSPVFYHDVRIQVKASRQVDDVLAGFGPEIPLPLLGERGYFDKFDVLRVFLGIHMIQMPRIMLALPPIFSIDIHSGIS